MRSLAAIAVTGWSLLVCGSSAADESPTTPSVASLLAKLESADLGIRRQAVISLGALGPKAVDAVPPLIGALDLGEHPLLDTRKDRLIGERRLTQHVAKALERIGAAAVPALYASLKNASGAGRGRILRVLARHADAKPSIFWDAVRHADPSIRAAAIDVLGHMSSPPESAIPMLVDVVKRRSVALRFPGPGELYFSFGHVAATVVLEADSDGRREAAIRALASYGPLPSPRCWS